MNTKRASIGISGIFFLAAALGVAATGTSGCTCDSGGGNLVYHLHVVDAQTGEPVDKVEVEGNLVSDDLGAVSGAAECEQRAADGKTCDLWTFTYDEDGNPKIGAPGYVSRPLPLTYVRQGELTCGNVDVDEATLTLEPK